MTNWRNRLVLLLLENATLLLLVAILFAFDWQSPRPFLTRATLVNILVQSSSVGIVAVGMTFVLLTAGIDLSVGSVMFVAAIFGGMAINAAVGDSWPLGVALAAGFGTAVFVGAAFGAINALLVTWGRIIPFIVTLGTLYVGRGLGLWLTRTQSLPLPNEVRSLGTGNVLEFTLAGYTWYIPFPAFMFLIVLIAAYFILAKTPFGRQVYAIGNDIEAAKKAGIRTRSVLFLVYAMSGVCAALAGIVSSWQLADVSPNFGEQREFEAIAAAVLGGTSLFGGRGKVVGTVLGAVLIQTVRSGLNSINANEYVYPIITSAVIFFAVLIDSIRFARLQKLKRRRIRVEA